MKQCTKCKKSKPYTEFWVNRKNKDGYEYYCKSCKSQIGNRKERDAKYYQKNKSRIIKANRAYELANKERSKENHRLYMAKRRKEDIEFRLIDNYRSRINVALKGQLKEQTFKEFIGCSIKQFKFHLESQFTDLMSWENYGIYWEIDHIKPLSKGGSFHYKNTQPLTIPANRSKSNKYEKLSKFNS
jgi:5-methylcytosine-specific restriction endonuclease McrA